MEEKMQIKDHLAPFSQTFHWEMLGQVTWHVELVDILVSYMVLIKTKKTGTMEIKQSTLSAVKAQF